VTPHALVRRAGRAALAVAALLAVGLAAPAAQRAADLQFVFTSDPHYGLTRPSFRGARNVSAHVVNAAMVAAINAVPDARFPKDGGLKADQPVGAIEFVVEGGDIANREETTEQATIQSASVSWREFQTDYLQGLRLEDSVGERAPIYTLPGNHDASNAIGFHRPMTPTVDKTAMVEIYNRMMRPAVPKVASTYQFDRDRVAVSHDIGGIHWVFLTVWPDSVMRAWMERDLRTVSASTPVMIFTHDQPECEAKHFRNPNGAHDINPTDRFENLLADEFADGPSIDAAPTIEGRAFEAFLHAHPNITAYFHGNSNWNQFYDWTGPGHTAVVHTFRVDSPMKGAFSAIDETRLSFQVVTIDPEARLMTVRECLWNTHPDEPGAVLEWGASTTVALYPRPPGA
jgi:hypothetical protein